MKTIIAVLLLTGTLWSGSGSAATMMLYNGLGGHVSKAHGHSVKGESTHSNPWNISTWQLDLVGVKPSALALVKFKLSLEKDLAAAIFDGKSISNGQYLKLGNGSHYLSIFPLGILDFDEEKDDHDYEFSFKDTGIQIAQTPVPAAIWLFGPALFAALRCRRKH